MNDRKSRDTKTRFESKIIYYKPVRVGKFYCNNYIEYESKGDGNKTLSTEEYLEEIKPYLKEMF